MADAALTSCLVDASPEEPTDRLWMARALELARTAGIRGEVWNDFVRLS